MKAEDKSFYFMAKESYYDIPFFQRAYVWSKENWEELIDNLSNMNQNHFLGSIILKIESAYSGQDPRFSIIDGQQRLTTLSILLRACYDHIVSNATRYELDEDSLKICEVEMRKLLFVSSGEMKPTYDVKIKHSRLDRKDFEEVIKGDYDIDDRWQKYVENDEDTTSHIIKAYAYFRNELNNKSQDTINYLWKLFTKDKIKFLVNIDLDPNDNEQEIFDTVNSSGVRLSSADTIKNLLYQKYVELLRAEGVSNVDGEAIKEYEATWVDAFIKDESTNVYWETQRQYGRMKRSYIETFLHAFAVIERFFDPSTDNMADLPRKYREHILKNSLDELEAFLKLLHDYAIVYKEYYSEEEDDLEFDDYIGRIFNICNALEVSTFHPYILQLLFAFKSNTISEDELIKKLFDLERYLIINAICKGSTKNYNNECIQLVENKKTSNEIMDSCIYISEENFKNGLRRMTTNKFATLLLFWVELYRRSSDKVDIKHLKYDFTLEHIMPQKWEQNWSNVAIYDEEGNIIDDQEDIERIRSRAIYEIGNMTLLNSKLNSSISNGTFIEKRDGKNSKKGIKDLADLLITKEILVFDIWNEKRIYSRSEEIEKEIREIWEVNDLPVEKLVKNNDNKGIRSTIRVEFWEKALPIIREKNGNGCFMNVTPRDTNVRTGSFGIGGFSVDCSANFDKARIDLVFNKSDVDKNKMAFDYLFSKKDEIENQLGVNLQWDRADDLRASYISYKNDSYSIAKEEEWEQMASFLGEWSNKFRKVMVPFLEEKFPIESIGKTPEQVSRLMEIFEAAKEWTVQNNKVNEQPDKSNRSYIRFTTPKMSKINPPTEGVKSDWNSDYHYFYEIINKTGKDIYIKLAFNSTNMTQDMKNLCDKINEIAPMKQWGENWVWWTLFRTSKVMIDDSFNKTTFQSSLDSVLNEIEDFENNLITELKIKY